MEKGKIAILPSHVTGLIAICVSTGFLVMHRDDLSIVAASIFFILACTIDTLKSKIPNILNLSMLVAGLTVNVVETGMHGALTSLIGLGLGMSLLLLPYLLGGMGAGDVKALGALGSLIGPGAILHVFVYMGLLGGAFALFHYLFKSDIRQSIHAGWHSVCASVLTRKADYILSTKSAARKDALRFPYSSAIALGYYCYIYWGGVL